MLPCSGCSLWVHRSSTCPKNRYATRPARANSIMWKLWKCGNSDPIVDICVRPSISLSLSVLVRLCVRVCVCVEKGLSLSLFFIFILLRNILIAWMRYHRKVCWAIIHEIFINWDGANSWNSSLWKTRSVCPDRSIPCLLITWRHKEPRHQQQ